MKYFENSSDNSSKILDVRTPEEFLSGHLEGSKNINFHDKDFFVWWTCFVVCFPFFLHYVVSYCEC